MKAKLNRVNEDIGGNVEAHITQTASAVAHLDTRLSYMNESMRDDFNDIKTVLNAMTQ